MKKSTQLKDDNRIDRGAGKILHTDVDMREGLEPAKETEKPQSDRDTSEKFYPNRHGKNQERLEP